MTTSSAQPALFGSTAEQDFRRLTQQRYAAMVKRFSEKRNKNGRIIRHGRIVPFSLKQYQAWVLEQLGGAVAGAVKCYYQCGEWINIHTMTNDHMTPVKQGGSLGLENFCACCKRCNSIKGGMMARTFLGFIGFVKTLPPADGADILHRLEISVRLAAGSRFAKTKQAKNAAALKTTAQQEIDDDGDF